MLNYIPTPAEATALAVFILPAALALYLAIKEALSS